MKNKIGNHKRLPHEKIILQINDLQDLQTTIVSTTSTILHVLCFYGTQTQQTSRVEAAWIGSISSLSHRGARDRTEAHAEFSFHLA